jgi:hypothetical protein
MPVKSITVRPHCVSGYLDWNGIHCAHFVHGARVGARTRSATMINVLSKGLNQKPAMFKGLPPATPSKAFALWLALLLLYFLLLPSAAQSPGRSPELAVNSVQSESPVTTFSAASTQRPW